MAQIIGLPKLSPTMEEGVLVRWTKKEGDKVSPGDLVAEVETDKANMDFNVEDEGVLLKLLVKEGDTVKLGAPVAIIGKAGEDVSALVEQARQPGRRRRAPRPPRRAAARRARRAASAAAGEGRARRARRRSRRRAPAAAAAPRERRRSRSPRRAPAAAPGKLLASPLAKTLAIELGIDLRAIQGSGPGGRIVERDVRAAAAGGGNGHAQRRRPSPIARGDAGARPRPPARRHDQGDRGAPRAPDARPDAARATTTTSPPSNMRKRIAARLTEAKRDVPHFYLMRQLDAAPLLAFRERLNELLGDRGKVSVNDLVIKAVALALRRDARVQRVVGPATRSAASTASTSASPSRSRMAWSRRSCAMPIRRASARSPPRSATSPSARSTRRLKAHEITGSTFTVSNLGMYRHRAVHRDPQPARGRHPRDRRRRRRAGRQERRRSSPASG